MTIEYVECPNCKNRIVRDWGWCSECGTKPTPASEQDQFLTNDVECPNCNTINGPGRQFCQNCGTILVRICPNCRVLNPWSINFCGKCGVEYETAKQEFIKRIKTNLSDEHIIASELLPTIEERLKYSPDDADMQSLMVLVEKTKAAQIAKAKAEFDRHSEEGKEILKDIDKQFKQIDRDLSRKKGCPFTATLALLVLIIFVLPLLLW